LLGVKSVLLDAFRQIFFGQVAEAFEDTPPVDLRVQVSEGPRKIVDAPGHLGLTVLRLLSQGVGLTIFVGFERVVHNPRNLVILSAMVSSQVNNGQGHRPLVHAAELAQGLEEVVVVVRATVAKVEEDLPRIQDFLDVIQKLESVALHHEVVGGLFKMAVERRQVLVQRAAQWGELAELVLHSRDQVLLRISKA